MTGHTVLAVGVPDLDDWVRTRTAQYDASFVSADPAFRHAHITLLAPWIANPAPSALDAVGRIAAEHPPFDTCLQRIDVFPDGLIHLRPEPDEPFRALTAALTAAFPAYPPYGGQFGAVDPHLTLDRVDHARGVTAATVAGELRDLLPVRLRVDRIDLQWWANHDCHVQASWKLG
ncbi:hypothetical protein BJF85_05525 [Saccharomonospora sp. CUA-673]|uniref:2'-5' RNA ligase family protein n=1 Tax=Saccharomonospora sp. CUA-673 TaxID=1904969 RepID=UPI0009699522|nr:2'-5' RNA ligase family protein [Saccharomonospora sp. CUA-673]OLT40611.1 hypothetical protein BJF85_05525 [Saccharomonospora sp. CUA-673]